MFGPVARAEASVGSDLDLLVQFEDMAPAKYASLYFALLHEPTGLRAASTRSFSAVLGPSRGPSKHQPVRIELKGGHIHVRVMTAKETVMITGPNGVGKTLFARQVLPRDALCNNFINADLIAAGLSLFSRNLPPYARPVWCWNRPMRTLGRTQFCMGERSEWSNLRTDDPRVEVGGIYAVFGSSLARSVGSLLLGTAGR